MLQPVQRALIHRREWLKMLAPRSCGGAEMPLPAAVRLEEAIASADASCGWVVTLCAGAGWFAGFLPPMLARQIVGTPRLCIAGSGAPSGHADREGDGWRINGHWSHASGAPMATHFTMNAVLRKGGAPVLDTQGLPRVRAFVVPAAGVQIVPTWHSIGLRATASHAFAVRDRWVPEDHAFDVDAAAATAAGALYRFPFRPFAFVTLAANLLGMARHFLELAETVIARRLQPPGGSRIGDPFQVQILVRRAREDVGIARTSFYGLLDSAWQQVESGIVLSAVETRRLEAAARSLANDCRTAVDGLYPYCGLHAADGRSDINRVWRDFHTATQHALWLQ